MECNKCGKCCKQMYLPLHNQDHARWAGLHGLRIFDINGVLHALIEKECLMLKDGKCEINNTKPEMCKDYKCNKVKYKELFINLCI